MRERKYGGEELAELECGGVGGAKAITVMEKGGSIEHARRSWVSLGGD